MSEEETPGIGASLRRARERKGWTTQDVSSRLRLMSRQVEAIEEEEFTKLGPPVFARGFVRNYAKLLGIDPDELLDQMTRIRTTPVPETEHLPFTPRQEFWKSPLFLGGVAAVLIVIAIPVGLYLWLGGDDEEKPAPAVEQAVPPPLPPVAPQIDQQAQQAQPVVPGQTTQAPAPAQAIRPPFPFPAPPAAVQKPVPAAAPQPTPAPAPAESTAPVKSGGPSLQFEESAWVQIRDGSGRVVHSGLNPAGSSVEVNGRPPFYLVVGNAEHVRLVYRGNTVDLKPFTAINVARLTLN